MRLSHYACQKSGELERRFGRQPAYRRLHILWAKLADEYRTPEEARAVHALADGRRKMARTLHDALRGIARNAAAAGHGCGGLNGLLYVDQTMIVGFSPLAFDAEQNGVAQPAKRAASLHPVCRVEKFERRLVFSLAQAGHQGAHLVA